MHDNKHLKEEKMNRKRSLILLVIGLTLAVSVGIANAQGPAPRANIGTAFTYQGQLKNNGSAVNGTCSFQFGLWSDAASLGSQVGTTVTVSSVNVTNGLFTAPIDFGANAFTGDARYLGIAVNCGSGLTTFASRQALTPAPMALALPGLYTQQNGTSPNLIGGYSGNIISPTVLGGTISGGGLSGAENKVWANYATIGGGRGNTASGNVSAIGGGRANTASGTGAYIGGGGYDGTNTGGNQALGNASMIGGGLGNIIPVTGAYATVSGGYDNTASHLAATVSGGNGNSASGDHATVGGGEANIASGSNATVGGGKGNTASDWYATVGGGYQNTASNYLYATVGGGDSNSASGDAATVGGGASNTASGTSATVGGGQANTASGAYSTVPGGFTVSASHWGEMAYTSTYIANSGDAQTSVYVLSNNTTGITQTELFLDPWATQRITLANNRTLTFDILIVARSSTGSSAGYRIQGVIKNVGGTTSFIGGAPATTVLGEDVPAWDAVAQADDTNDALVIKVTGAASTSIYWVATVRTAEVAY
jgi:hypothetical protein